MNPSRFLALLPRLRAVAALAVLLAAPCAFAAKKVVADVTAEYSFMVYYGTSYSFALNNQGHLYDTNLTTTADVGGNNRYFIASPTFTDDEPAMYVDEIRFDLPDTRTLRYSLYVSTNYDISAPQSAIWDSVASNVATTESASFEIQDRIKAIKFVFENGSSQTALAEFHVTGYRSSVPTKISSLARSIFIRSGDAATPKRGKAGFNGGHYSDRVFNGNFTDYAYMNGSALLIIPTTGLNESNATDGSGTPWYVTEFKVGHKGNSKYSLYYTTEPEPADIITVGDTRNWTAIEGATGIQEQGTKTYIVNKTATAVKYVFDTYADWGQSLAEVEVWAINPDDLPCTHENLDLATATWTPSSPATCTENATEECFCPDCGKRFAREVPLTKLGHIYVATLTRMGRPDRYGSGYVSCARTLEDPDTGETTWSCDFRIDFDGHDVDFTTLGGVPLNGVVQYTDLTASSTGGQNGGITPEDVMDNVWTDQWNGYWFAENLSTNEYIQYKFGTTIELTTIEFSVLNQSQTVYFSKYDPETGEETIIKTIPIAKDESEGALGYQRQTVNFFVYDKLKKTFLDAVRMRIGDYVDPETGEVTAYTGTSYSGGTRNTCIIEFHPWGTIQYAGLMKHPPTTIMVLR